MSVFDFKGGFIKILVYVLDKESSLKGGPEDYFQGQRCYDLSASSLRPYVSGVTINEKPGGSNEITVDISPPTYKEGLYLLDSDLVKIGNIVCIKWGYSRTNALASPWYSGQMYKPSVSFEDAGLSFSLNAQSAGYLGARNQTGFEYKDTSIKEIVFEKADKYKVKLNVNNDNDLSVGANRAFTRKQKTIFQRSMDDLTFIRLLCKNIGLRVSLTGTNTLNILDPRALGGKAARPFYTFRYFGQLDIENNVYPMLSFNSDSDVMFLPDTSTEGTVFGPDDSKEDAGKFIKVGAKNSERYVYSTVYAPDIMPDIDIDMDIPSASYKVGIANGHSRRIVKPSRDENAEESIKGQEAIDAESAGAKATCEIYDLPMLLPEEIVKVEGVGRFFSVNYQVREISRSLNDGGWIDTLTLQSSGLAAYIDMLKRKSANTRVENTVKGSDNSGVVVESWDQKFPHPHMER